MSAIATKNLWRVLAISAAITFAYASVFRKLAFDWWHDDNYSHGLLVPVAIGYILWSQRERLRRAVSVPSLIWGGAAVLCALFALWAGIAGAELYIQRLSLVLMLIGITVYFRGFGLLRHMLVPLLLLFLALPIPAIILNRIAFPLQLFASRCAVWSMQLFGIPVYRQGNIIELLPLNSLETKKLEVVEACSGIRSLMTLLTLALVFAYFTHPRRDEPGNDQPGIRYLGTYGFWRSLIIVTSAIPIAILTNALRVSGTGILSRYYGTRIADGFFHSFSGWVIYVVAFLLLFAVGWILDRFRPAGLRAAATNRATSARAADEKKSVSSSPQVAASAKGAD